MTDEKIVSNLKNFDAELWQTISASVNRQLSSLSLVPTTNAVSPFVAYLKGSSLSNENIEGDVNEEFAALEKMAAERVCRLFGAEHAIVRTGSLAIASRVVLFALAKNGDKILSFNLRKQEHCSGEQMRYDFVKFAIEPDTFRLDFEKIRALAREHKPRILIYSPVNYPYNIDCHVLREIADEVGAYLWVDLGQNAGLAAAKEIPSPVGTAHIVTFSAGDALHGPQNGIILCRKSLADILEQTVVDTGHVSLKKNVLAALAVAFKEAACEEYQSYAQQVLYNARALEGGLRAAGCETLCAPTENHLVLVRLGAGQDGEQTAEKLARAGLMVKAERLLTSDDNISYPVLRLSSLDATTRSLREEDMFKVGRTLGEFLRSSADNEAISKVRKVIKKLVNHLPIFAEEWLPEVETNDDYDNAMAMKAMIYWNV